MSDLKNAIVLRNKVYHEMTDKVFALFHQKLDKAIQYVTKLDRDISWGSVELVKGNDNFITVMGYLHVEEGDIVTSVKGEKIVVDETFMVKHSTKTIVKLILALDKLEHGDAAEVFEHIKCYYELGSMMAQEDIINLLSDFHTLEALLEEAKRVVETGQPSKVKDTTATIVPVKPVETDFDLSSLSEEYRNMVMQAAEITLKHKN